MTKDKVLKIVGVSAIVIGSVCFYFAGVGKDTISLLVAGVFALVAIVAAILK